MERQDGFPLPMHPDVLMFPQENKSDDAKSSGVHSPLTFQKPSEELAVVHRTEQPALSRLETHLEEPTLKHRTYKSRCNIPNGLASELFRPLWTAVYHPKKLQKRTVIHADLERLCIALLNAVKMDERPFLTVGCHVKGLCIILSQKLQVIVEDTNALAKKLLLLTTTPAIAGRPKHRKTYRETDDDYELPKRRRNTNKAKKTRKQMLALEDYYDTGKPYGDTGFGECNPQNQDETRRCSDIFNSDGDYMPMDQIEVLQLMNFGIGLGVGTDLAFYSNGRNARDSGISYHNFEHGMVERPVLSLEALQQNRETINPDTFMDVQLLSSPFKLNGYSFTPVGRIDSNLHAIQQTRLSEDLSEADTTIASTELTLQSDSVELNTPQFKRYDLDWDIYNDPFEDEESFVSNDSRTSGEIVPASESKGKRMVLQYTEPDGKAVHLVKSKSVARYDSNITSGTSKTPKKVKIAKNQKTLDTFAVSPKIVCDKMQVFTDAIDSLVRSVIGHMPHEESVHPNTEGTPHAAEGTASRKTNRPSSKLHTTRHGESWLNNLKVHAASENRPQTPKHTFDNETMSTVQVIEGYRACVREQGAGKPIAFSNVVQGRSKASVALIFYRTLVLANADFITLSQAIDTGSQIEVTPSRRFWEPIQTSKDIKA